MKIYQVINQRLLKSINDVLEICDYENVKVFNSHSGNREPSEAYCILNILDISQTGRSSEATKLVKDTDILESMSHYKIMSQLSFKGVDSSDIATTFNHSLKNNRACRDAFQLNDFGILEKSNLRRIPDKRETQWVDSFNMDVVLSYAVLTRQSYDWVEYVTINGEVIHVTDNNK